MQGSYLRMVWGCADSVGSFPKTNGSCSAFLEHWEGGDVPVDALALSISIDVISFFFLLLYIILIRHAASKLQKEAYHENRMVSNKLSPFTWQ